MHVSTGESVSSDEDIPFSEEEEEEEEETTGGALEFHYDSLVSLVDTFTCISVVKLTNDIHCCYHILLCTLPCTLVCCNNPSCVPLFACR